MIKQMPLLQPESNWAPPDILPSFDPKEELALDLETKDPHLIDRGPGWATDDGHIVGIGLASKSWSGYLPIRHEGGGNLDDALVLRWLKKTLQQRTGPLICHNALYDVGWLKREGIDIKTPIYDTMFAAPLLNEHRRSYSLNNLGADYCDDVKDETLLESAAHAYGVNKKSELYQLPAKYVGEYGEQDAVLTLKLWDKLSSLVQEEGIQQIFQMECDLIPLLLEMRWRGVKIDTSRVEEVSELLSKQEQQLYVESKRKFGTPIEIWSNASIERVFKDNGLWYPKSPTGLASFQAPWLEAHEHELPQTIVRLRKLNKARTTFVEKMISGHMVNGRIHAEAHPLRSDEGGTVTGRFSYSNPNLQQVPAKDPEIGKLIRSCFIPEEGAQWGVFDYSQQEPRLTVHYAAELSLRGSKEAVKAYSEEGADFHQVVADMAGISRKHAKNINLGLTYGMGKDKLIKELGCEAKEATTLLTKYHDRVPFVRALQSQCARIANERGYLTTLGGRYCRFDQWESTNWDEAAKNAPMSEEEARDKYGSAVKRAYTYKALNKLIQGSAADMTKLAMLALWKEGYVPHIQIHDELDYSVQEDKETEMIINKMTTCVELNVPLVVEPKLGTNWGEIK
tara:strand:- start:525 stop:2393 length:1869 start_codon:yes stop_codon:yes gene_type:complete